jgi:hypothetical protein
MKWAASDCVWSTAIPTVDQPTTTQQNQFPPKQRTGAHSAQSVGEALGNLQLAVVVPSVLAVIRLSGELGDDVADEVGVLAVERLPDTRVDADGPGGQLRCDVLPGGEVLRLLPQRDQDIHEVVSGHEALRREKGLVAQTETVQHFVLGGHVNGSFSLRFRQSERFGTDQCGQSERSHKICANWPKPKQFREVSGKNTVRLLIAAFTRCVMT